MATETDPKTRENTAESSRNSRTLRPLMALAPYALAYRGRIVLAFLALTVAAAATLVVPVAMRRMIDFGFSVGHAAAIDSYFLAMTGVVLILALASAARYYLVMTLGERVVADVRTAVFAHLTQLSPLFFDTVKTGEVLSRLTADTTQIKAAFGSSASVALRNLFLFAGAVVMMVWTSPKLSALVLIAIPLIVLPLVAFGRSVRTRSRKAQDTLANASAYASEIIGAMRVVQAFTAERLAIGRFSGEVENAYQAAATSTRSRAMLTAIALFLVFASVVGVLWLGAHDVVAGTMTAGTLSQFVLYAVFGAGALSELGQVWAEIVQAAGAAERLGELLGERPAISAPARPLALPEPARGAVAFEGVTFAYPAQPDKPVLHDVDLAVKAGETVAIVGPSGAGKSTLFQLLLRYYDPQFGRVRLDGVALPQADPKRVRQRIAVVAQDPVVFAATARDNIRFGRPDASDAEVEEAARLAAADGFIRAMPQGYDTPIGERGVTLSGGQRQRIAIARAILKDAPVLLLDEATSALDSESEKAVQAALDGLMTERTTLVIAHRLATVQAADRIIVLDDGRIVEEGTHEALVARGGLYARLAQLQFRDAA
ncbi:ABC transporter transmembrane domain-containing protein [Labrys neptuniae]|uniref:ABC transporter transmembrane domain-containing protein n=1 Tax=Labrys neptuniae TaxID=376174 RepID=A0ABV3PSA5_9HYPH|nr:ABC transporter transmembrane domain-containing protein [Labrys neptuniae]MDT3379954.1 ABC transporter transmembrane domain-containing protein [Labrys neptuniae]